MSNYFEYNDKIAFHPGYYVKEIVDEYGLTQEDFAKRLDTTPKTLSKLINGEQNLSREMALKLSRLLGNSVNYWLNLQSAYDALLTEFESAQEMERERQILDKMDYNYFRDNYGLPDLPRKKEEQIVAVRELLQLSSLNVLSKYDMAASFRSASLEKTTPNIIRSNAMVQIAINEAMQVDAPKFNKQTFTRAAFYALSLTTQHDSFYPLIKEAFRKAGVILIVMPNMKGSKINGATKKINDKIMLMVNDRRLYSDTFWFTLFHEIGHIMNGDFGMSLENSDREKKADDYARNQLIPQDEYEEFVHKNPSFDFDIIVDFAKKIDRDPGIVLGRLQNDGLIDYKDTRFKVLRKQYKVITKQ